MGREIEAGSQLIEDVVNGLSLPILESGLNIISCPSCSRVENEAFVELTKWVEENTQFAKEYDVTFAVMGCRVNGPGETDHADIGAWCGKTHVNLKRGHKLIGQFTYEDVRPRIIEEAEKLIELYNKKRNLFTLIL